MWPIVDPSDMHHRSHPHRSGGNNTVQIYIWQLEHLRTYICRYNVFYCLKVLLFYSEFYRSHHVHRGRTTSVRSYDSSGRVL
ncbi:hypothetical protein NY2A_b127L [Paramecium bursaria Chlorella virus NY2A]|uniref:Uncharacterized protein b127L n=1 Tax=Paramecium bursaria Chlorella virus NY2A TaxID=46021 RepID=A7IW02_PBCVN|nr:hypothetical protein NY2A_b127L [Paramecium bursaria Chlorella virus NY2A]ABT14526.1 hypothetical protein NY2A_b127L [Paramecium bursaria Chlorella virus NY2A]